jgi:large subunit ribosomal protein L29
MKKYQYIHDLSLVELKEGLKQKRTELRELRFKHAVQPLENPNLLGEGKKMIARYLTELRQRELNTNQ